MILYKLQYIKKDAYIKDGNFRIDSFDNQFKKYKQKPYLFRLVESLKMVNERMRGVMSNL